MYFLFSLLRGKLRYTMRARVLAVAVVLCLSLTLKLMTNVLFKDTSGANFSFDETVLWLPRDVPADANHSSPRRLTLACKNSYRTAILPECSVPPQPLSLHQKVHFTSLACFTCFLNIKETRGASLADTPLPPLTCSGGPGWQPSSRDGDAGLTWMKVAVSRRAPPR